MDITLTLTGNLGADVEFRTTRNGMPIASFPVATTPRRRHEGNWVDGPTTWNKVEAFWDLADHCARSLRKGDPVIVHGRLRTQAWLGPDQTEHVRQVVEAQAIGHDLSFGASSFQRLPRQRRQRLEETPPDPADWPDQASADAWDGLPTPLTPESALSADASEPTGTTELIAA